MHGTSTTRISLLQILRDKRGDDEAWGEFVRVYGPAVAEWCRERGLQHDDALDVTQDVLIRFWQTSKQFSYNPRGRFRSYLEQVARSALVRWAEQAGAAHDQATRSLLDTPSRSSPCRPVVAQGPGQRRRAASCPRRAWPDQSPPGRPP